MFFFLSGEFSLKGYLFMSIYYIFAALAAAVSKAAQFSDGKDFSRKSVLTAETVIRLLIGAEGGSLAKILHDAGIQATASALSQRRAQIPSAVFRAAFDRFNSTCTDSELFRGYRLLAVDGTTVNLPRNPKAPSFVQNAGIPKGVNQLHVTPFYDILSRTFTDLVIQPEPRKDENGALVEMLKRNTFTQKTLIIADRGFESYNLIAHCLEKENVDFLIRVRQNYSAMREVAKLPMMELDCTIRPTITTTQTKEDKKNGYVFLQVPKKSKAGSKTRRGRWDFSSPYPMRFRICRFLLDNGEFETVATSLPSSFTLADIKELYHLRWGIDADGSGLGTEACRSFGFHKGPQALGDVLHLDDAAFFGHIAADDLTVAVDVESCAIQSTGRSGGHLSQGDVRISRRGSRLIRYRCLAHA